MKQNDDGNGIRSKKGSFFYESTSTQLLIVTKWTAVITVGVTVVTGWTFLPLLVAISIGVGYIAVHCSNP